ncbi:MAG: phosphate ABC transporter substrate-binding protein, PhoT family [Chitinophagaceae bacterium]
MIGLLKQAHYSLFIVALFFVFAGCSNNTAEAPKDTKDSGTIYISVDESFEPVIDSQIKVYEALHPGTSIIPFYKSEADCFKDFNTDSTRMIIVTRRLLKAEEDFIVDSFKVAPKSMIVARDAIAVIVNPAQPDSLFTMDELKEILTGRYKKSLNPVFDGINATSTVRFIIDSVLRGDSLTPKAMAARSSEGVIDYVSKNVNAVGFISVNWIGNPEDSTQMSFLKKVKMAQLESKDIKGSYILPVQANIYYNRYPMIRDLVYILKERHSGLGNGFANFMSGEKGQKLFKRSYLWPAQLNKSYISVEVE